MAERVAAGLRVHLRQEAPIPLDAHLECEPAQTLALVGPSGSGKSTILRCIAGLRAAKEGRIECADSTWYDTKTGTNKPPQQRAVGFVFQNYALFPHLTALGNVAAALGHVAPDARSARAKELLAKVHLDGLESRRPAELSGGQQQRVAVARALARDPQVLLLDEPFSAVDRVTRQKLYRELAELRRSTALPMVLVTHDLDEAAMLADRMTILHRGRTLQTGAPREVMARPADALVARLVDLKNVFEGRLQPAGPDAPRLVWNGRALELARAPPFEPGSRVAWGIPMSGVLLHRRDRPSRGEHENPVDGTVAEAYEVGDDTVVGMRVASTPILLWMRVPTHVAQRNRVVAGEPIRASLLAEMIHVMPWSPLGTEA